MCASTRAGTDGARVSTCRGATASDARPRRRSGTERAGYVLETLREGGVVRLSWPGEVGPFPCRCTRTRPSPTRSPSRLRPGSGRRIARARLRACSARAGRSPGGTRRRRRSPRSTDGSRPTPERTTRTWAALSPPTRSARTLIALVPSCHMARGLQTTSRSCCSSAQPRHAAPPSNITTGANAARPGQDATPVQVLRLAASPQTGGSPPRAQTYAQVRTGAHRQSPSSQAIYAPPEPLVLTVRAAY